MDGSSPRPIRREPLLLLGRGRARTRSLQPPAARLTALARARAGRGAGRHAHRGASAGAIAGFAGGSIDAVITRVAEVVLVLPALYVLLALRSALPQVLSPAWTFGITAVIFALVGWPVRGARRPRDRGRRTAPRVRGRRSRARREPAPRAAARTCCPRRAGFLRTQFALLLPACILAEATLSYAGIGFTDAFPSWGTLLQEAANIGLLPTRALAARAGARDRLGRARGEHRVGRGGCAD